MYLSDKEKGEIEKFYNNEIMREAVRKVLLAGLYSNGVLLPDEPGEPSKNFALFEAFQALNHGVMVTDDEIGQVIRGKAQGIKIVEMAFNELSNIKVEMPKNKTNKPNIAE